MKKKSIATFMAMALIAASLSGCGAAKTDESADATQSVETTEASSQEADKDTIYQVSLLQGLTFGDYHGSVKVSELKKKGDTGIGTFDGLNGELIMLDGVVYRAAGDGSVEEVPDDETIPFSNVTFFEEDEKESLKDISDFDALREILDKKVESLGKNKFYMIHIDGTFNEMNVRSEYAQKEPYEPLADVLEHDQTFFDYKDVEGTIVGLYCPPYMEDLNAVGWHLHFVSKDRKMGGHVLGMKFDEAELAWDYTDGFQMMLPEDEMFRGFDLTVDQSEDIKKVETDAGEEDASSTDSEEETDDKSSREEPTTEVNEEGMLLSSDSSDFVLLSEAVPDAILEIRYYSTYNFVGERIDGYEEPVAMLTKEAAAALKEVSDELAEKGYRLKIYDAYRPQKAVDHFVRWSEDPDDAKMKEYFYPDLEKKVLFSQGYVATKSNHTHGSTVDLTLFDMRTEKEVDMGGTFDFFGEISHPDYKGITEEQYNNRMILREAMMNHGFTGINNEWWHFTLDNEPYPDTYFTFDLSSDVLD